MPLHLNHKVCTEYTDAFREATSSDINASQRMTLILCARERVYRLIREGKSVPDSLYAQIGGYKMAQQVLDEGLSTPGVIIVREGEEFVDGEWRIKAT